MARYQVVIGSGLILGLYAASCGDDKLKLGAEQSVKPGTMVDAGIMDGPAVPVPVDGNVGTTGAMDHVDSGSCGNLLGTPEEIASTPRASLAVELAALKIDGTFVASQATYDRISSDLAAIREANSAIDESASETVSSYFKFSLEPYGFINGKVLRIGMDAGAITSVVAGTYRTWDCLNMYYGLVAIDITPQTNPPMVTLVLKGNYNTNQLVSLYKPLPGVVSAWAEWATGDPGVWDETTHESISNMYLGRSGEQYQYAFHLGEIYGRGGGWDSYYCYQTDAPGVVTTLGQWSSGAGVDAGNQSDDCKNLFIQLCLQYTTACW